VNPKERTVGLQRDSFAKLERVTHIRWTIAIAVVGVELGSEDQETLTLNLRELELPRLQLRLGHSNSGFLESSFFPW
jgi:hypothetical protein